MTNSNFWNDEPQSQLQAANSEAQQFVFISANSKHLDQIAGLHLMTIRQMAEIAPPGFGKGIRRIPSLDEIKAEFAEAIEAEDACLLVALAEAGRIAGFVLGVIETHGDDLVEAPYMTIQYLEVHPDYGKAGIGSGLLSQLESHAKKVGVTALELAVWEGNSAAKSLYEKHGFVPLERRLAKLIGIGE